MKRKERVRLLKTIERRRNRLYHESSHFIMCLFIEFQLTSIMVLGEPEPALFASAGRGITERNGRRVVFRLTGVHAIFVLPCIVSI